MQITSGDLARPERGVLQAVYLVFIRVHPGNPGDPNIELVAAKLSNSSAKAVQLNYPGAWIEKVFADKN